MDKVFTSNYLLLQPDFSVKETLSIAANAHREGKKVVLYTVPNKKIKRKLLRYVSIAIFNEIQISEVAKVSIDGLPSVKTAVLRIYGRGVETVIVKMYDGRMLVFAEERFLYLDVPEKDLEEMNNQYLAKELKLVMQLAKVCSA